MSAGSRFGRSRRSAVAVAAGAVAAMALAPGVAGAATVKGTVVAKDVGRGTVVTVDRAGAATTLRVPAAGRLRIGQRLTATATRRTDGTYAASRVRRSARLSARARLRATVVQRHGLRLLVSAGGSTFAIRTRTRAAAASVASAALPAAGDVVVADVKLGPGGPAEARLRAVGQTGMVEVEGAVVDAAGGVLKLAVEDQGIVSVTIPAGQQVQVVPGEEVEAIVSVAADGSFALVALAGEGEHGGDDHGIDYQAEDGVAEVKGAISALAADAVTVSAGPAASVTCRIPAGTSLDGFVVGDVVEMKCRQVDATTFELVELDSEHRQLEVDGEHGHRGTSGDGSPDGRPSGDGSPSGSSERRAGRGSDD